MEIQYYKDAKHNYLILEAEPNDENLFQYKMLENNRIDGLLPFSLRNMDERYYLYYEIDSRQSIKNRYERRKMSYEKLVRFLSDLVSTAKNIGDYLLDPVKLQLIPEMIFEDFSSGNFSFIYDPAREKELDQSFLEGLMDYVDLEDSRSSGLIFDLLDSICDERGIDFCILEKSIKNNNADPFSEEIPISSTCKDIYETRISMNEQRVRSLDYDEDFEDDEDDEAEEAYETTNRKIKIKLPVGVNLMMAITFAAVAGVLWYLRYAYILTYEENIIDIAVFIISVMMSLSCFLMQLRKNDKLFGRKKKEAEPKKEPTPKPKKETAPGITTMEDEENEETVLLSYDFGGKGHKLYAEEGSEHDNIGLSHLPVVIGKLSSCADAIIKEKSVSRMHAKIFKMDQSRDSLWLQDLNSKNGTFINGKKLMVGEKVELFEGDEVSFGRCVFTYR